MDVTMLPPVQFVAPTTDPSLLAAQAHQSGANAVETVASGFESMFASLMVKELRQSLEPDTMFGQDRSEILGGLFDFYMGQHLAVGGMLGIGAMVKKQLQTRKSP
jgi:Rod binding domain-containing protein